MLIAWMVLMPSSEKSFAASSLVCLSMRTVTLTVSMRTPPASRAHDTAIVRAAGGMFPESVMARRISVAWRLKYAATRSHAQRWYP